MDVESLLEFRRLKDAHFRSSPNSPIPEPERAGFAGLAYFPPSPALALRLPLEPDPSREGVVLETSTGSARPYERVGWVSFEVDGLPARLAVFQPEGAAPGEGLFLPFRDATSGRETYGAGRYLEPELAPDGLLVLDFNRAYSPYCAYSDAWSCPLPPAENWIGVPIRAGERG